MSTWIAALVALSLAGGCSPGVPESTAPETPTNSPPAESAPVGTPTPTPIESAVVEMIDMPVAAWVGGESAVSGDTICSTWGALSRFNEDGLQAIIEDETGAIVGTGTMSPAEQHDGGCLREATVSIPGDREFYQLKMGPWESAVVARADLTDETFQLRLRS